MRVAAESLHSCLYVGTIMHARGGPSANSFRYPHAFVAIDLDELPLLERRLRPFGLPLFGHRRRGLVSIDEQRDWMRTDEHDGTLRDDVLAWATRAGAPVDPASRVLLVAMPRQLGHSFNPITIFYVTPPDAPEPSLAVVEVHSTFGERHRYLASVGDVPSQHAKRLHVSPFLPMQGTYHMHLPPPGERFLARIDLTDAGVPFVATWTGRRRPLTSRSLAGMLLRQPLGARLALLRIHLQALRLWRRHAPLYRKPPFIEGEGTIS